MKKIKLFAVDDHVALRDALGVMLEGTGKIEITGRASNGEQAVAAFEKGAKADVLLLDINMPKMNGYETAERMRKIAPEVNILFLTMLETDYSLMRTLKLGAKGVVKKDISMAELQLAIERVAEGKFYFCDQTARDIAQLVAEAGIKTSSIHRYDFTEQELEFIRHCGSDMAYKEIGAEMGITPVAAECLRQVVFEKAGAKSRNGLILFGVKNGLITY